MILTPEQLAAFKEAFYNNKGDEGDDPFVLAFAALEIKQQPVAWRYRFKDSAADNWSGVTLDRPNPGQEKHFVTEPLFTSPSAQPLPLYRHKKRGSTYEVIGVGKMQAESWVEKDRCAADDWCGCTTVDMREVTIYRSTEDGSLWVRPREQFEDGRFELVAADAS